MRQIVIVGITLLTLSTAMAAEHDVPINIDVTSDDLLLRSTMRAAITSKVRLLPHVNVVADSEHALYTIVLAVGKLGDHGGWTSAYMFLTHTACGRDRLPVFKKGGVVSGSSGDIETMMAVIVNTFDETLTADRQNWSK